MVRRLLGHRRTEDGIFQRQVDIGQADQGLFGTDRGDVARFVAQSAGRRQRLAKKLGPLPHFDEDGRGLLTHTVAAERIDGLQRYARRDFQHARHCIDVVADKPRRQPFGIAEAVDEVGRAGDLVGEQAVGQVGSRRIAAIDAHGCDVIDPVNILHASGEIDPGAEPPA